MPYKYNPFTGNLDWFEKKETPISTSEIEKIAREVVATLSELSNDLSTLIIDADKDWLAKNIINLATLALVGDGGANASTINIGGLAQPSANYNYGFLMKQNTALVSGLAFKNTNIAGESRFSIISDDDAFLSFTMGNSANPGVLFGMNRKDFGGIWTNMRATGRSLLIGNYSNGDLIFGTNNIQRMVIKGTDGAITLLGTARTINALWIDAQAIRAPTTNPAELISHGILETPAFQFANAIEANQENVTFNMRIPNRMDRSVAPTLSVGWSADGSSPGNCRWQLEYLWTSPGEDTGAGAQEILYVTGTATVTADGFVVSTFTGIDLPSATDFCLHCRITRLSADALDTIVDTVELHGVCFSWTSDKLGLPI